jgi:NADPH:quinone reductase-like Zn-dependent oxidoreductase
MIILSRGNFMNDKKLMKAVRIEAAGDYSTLNYGDYPMPEMGDEDILVKVMATSVSGWDIKYRRGDLFGKTGHSLPGRPAFPLPQQLGREAAGVVIAVGSLVKHFCINDRVMGLVHPENKFCDNTLRGLGNLSTDIAYPGHVMFGGYAQYVSRPESYWLKIPDNVSFDQAAAGSWSYPTSHRIIVDRCRVKMGDTVLITGISGSIGNALLQWAHLSGAIVIGTTTNESKVDDIKKLGVDHIIVTADIDQANKQIKKITNNFGVDHVIELTGSAELKSLCLDSLACGGTICPLGESTQDDSFSVKVKKHLVGLELTVVGIRGSQLSDQYVFLKMLSQGKINVPIAKILPLDKIQLAHQLVEERRVVGKVVLHPW